MQQSRHGEGEHRIHARPAITLTTIRLDEFEGEGCERVVTNVRTAKSETLEAYVYALSTR